MSRLLITFALIFTSLNFASAQIVTSTSLDIQVSEVEKVKKVRTKTAENSITLDFWALPIVEGDFYYGNFGTNVDREYYTTNFALSYNRSYIHHTEGNKNAFIGGFGFDFVYRPIKATVEFTRLGVYNEEYDITEYPTDNITANYLGGNIRGMIGVRFNSEKSTNSDLYLSLVAGVVVPTSTGYFPYEDNSYGVDYIDCLETAGLGLGYNINIKHFTLGAEAFYNLPVLDTQFSLNGLMLKIGYRWGKTFK